VDAAWRDPGRNGAAGLWRRSPQPSLPAGGGRPPANERRDGLLLRRFGTREPSFHPTQERIGYDTESFGCGLNVAAIAWPFVQLIFLQNLLAFQLIASDPCGDRESADGKESDHENVYHPCDIWNLWRNGGQYAFTLLFRQVAAAHW
jgi:hypothetical protein